MAKQKTGITDQLEADLKKALESFEKEVDKALCESSPTYNREEAYFYSAAAAEVKELMNISFFKVLKTKYENKYRFGLGEIR